MRAVALAVVLLVSQVGWAGPAAARSQPDPIQGQVEVVHTAYDLLLDRFVYPLDAPVLLEAAWAGIDRSASERGTRRPGPAPALPGGRGESFEVFAAALSAYLAAAPGLPDDFVPAHEAVRAMAAAVSEEHTYFLDPPQYQDYLEWSSGGVAYAGLGVRLGLSDMVIREVYPAGPADVAGLQAGDRLVSLDGRPLAGLDRDHATSLLRGPEGSVADLVVRRPGDASEWPLQVRRQRVVVPELTSRWLDGTTAYLRLRSFPEGPTADQFERALLDFDQGGACGLVVDLRGNGGGRIEVGARLLSLFLPTGAPILERIDRSGGDRTWVAEDGQTFGQPLVVLVDDGTASMGELFAAAIQANGRGVIVGSATHGMVAGGKTFPLGDGSGLEVTVLDLRSAAGGRLNGVGVTPDVAVAGDAPSDVALDQARTLLPSAPCER